MAPEMVSQCPCCGYRTGCSTCPVCFWTDEGRGAGAGVGPNGDLSIGVAQLNFAIYGASHPRYQELVRPPRLDEHP